MRLRLMTMVCRCTLLAFTLLAFTLLGSSLLASTARADGSGIEITAPQRIMGDGKTPVTIVVKTTMAPQRAAAVQLSTNGGTIGQARSVAAGVTEFTFVPPHVADELNVTLEAKTVANQGTAKAQVKVVAPPDDLVARRSKGMLGLSAPARMVLGLHDHASLQVRSTRRLRWFTNAGTIRDSHAGANGQTATFLPAEKATPHVAIVAAVESKTGRFDWLPIAMYGRGRMEVDTAPRAVLVLKLGGVEYGPVTADKRGRALVPLVVPPGVTAAESFARNTLGNVARSTVPMGAPPFNRLLVLCPEGRPRVLFLVVDARGRPAEQAKFVATISRGTLSAPARIGPGVFAADVALPPDISGPLEVRAQLQGEPQQRSSCTMAHATEVPQSSSLRVEPTAFVAGSTKSLHVTVNLVYSGKLPPQAMETSLDANVGTVSRLTKDANGVLSAEWKPPSFFSGQREAKLTLRVKDAPWLDKSSTVELQPDRPVRLELTSSRVSLPADPGSTAVLTLKAFDRYGNPTFEVRPRTTAIGAVGPFRLVGGALKATYTAPLTTGTTTPGIDTIVVRDERGPGRAQIRVEIERGLQSGSVALRLGWLTNFAKVSGPMGEASLLWRLPMDRRRPALGVDVATYASSHDNLSDVGDTVTTRVKAVPVLVRAAYTLFTHPVCLHLAGRAGVTASDVHVSSDTIGHRASQQWGAAFGGLLGAEINAGPGAVATEAGYLYSAADEPRTLGNLAGAHLSLGYALRF